MFSRKMIALFAITVSLLSLASASSAALISVDINESTVQGPTGTPTSLVKSGDEVGGFTGQVGPWNSLNAGPGVASITSPLPTAPLLASPGGVTPVVFTILTGNPLILGNDDSGSNDPLRGDALHMNNTTQQITTWQITGLLAGNPYDLKFFGQFPAPGLFASTFSVTGAGPPNPQTTSDVATFLGVTATGGTISGSISGGLSSWSGMQIQGTFIAEAVPEPSTFILAALGLAGLGLVALRRRKANVE